MAKTRKRVSIEMNQNLRCNNYTTSQTTITARITHTSDQSSLFYVIARIANQSLQAYVLFEPGISYRALNFPCNAAVCRCLKVTRRSRPEQMTRGDLARYASNRRHQEKIRVKKHKNDSIGLVYNDAASYEHFTSRSLELNRSLQNSPAVDSRPIVLESSQQRSLLREYGFPHLESNIDDTVGASWQSTS
jgi:hypothetical protein